MLVTITGCLILFMYVFVNIALTLLGDVRLIFIYDFKIFPSLFAGDYISLISPVPLLYFASTKIFTLRLSDIIALFRLT